MTPVAVPEAVDDGGVELAVLGDADGAAAVAQAELDARHAAQWVEQFLQAAWSQAAAWSSAATASSGLLEQLLGWPNACVSRS
eukprot:CAMPEP_0172607732 /NCGR_PEP_ID=MMETSP1068-20121228/27882_2 /TAXON_ID=35684 /ORGANISM="Pseudopedinella elastica, Strain CCMP716" /LENGTH=82 /DNA_ID=CAMNT_0013410811 /DNA_START=178 /DNA_END=424 /DNA_ORIENTATION=-